MMRPQRQTPGTAGTVRGGGYQSTVQHFQNTETPLQKLSARARGFRRTGPDQGVMCCTALDHDDKHPSLCWRELSDGRLLLFCQSGCDTADVLAGAGLTMADLFPDAGRNHGRPVPPGQRWNYRDLIKALRRETTLICICAHDLANNRPLAESDRQRLIRAAQRVYRVAEVAK